MQDSVKQGISQNFAWALLAHIDQEKQILWSFWDMIINSDMMLNRACRTEWDTLLLPMQKWWETSCISTSPYTVGCHTLHTSSYEGSEWTQIVPHSEVPESTEVVPSVWAVRRKHILMTNEIPKHKAHLNLHGGKQIYGINYFKTYAPVVI